MKKTLLSLTISSLFFIGGCSLIYPPLPSSFITKQSHLREAKKELEKYGEKFDSFKNNEDYDRDRIKDIAIISKKGKVYYASSRQILEGNLEENDSWTWFRTE